MQYKYNLSDFFPSEELSIELKKKEEDSAISFLNPYYNYLLILFRTFFNRTLIVSISLYHCQTLLRHFVYLLKVDALLLEK